MMVLAALGVGQIAVCLAAAVVITGGVIFFVRRGR